MTSEPDQDLLRHQAFLQRLALRLVRDEHTARDLVQSASVAYLMAPPHDGGAARAWLARVVRRLATRGHRAERHRGDRERSVARPESEPHELAAVDAALDAQSALLDLVRGLPDAQREAIVLRYLHDQSPADIAAQIGVSVHTINTRLRRALERLRDELDRRAQGDRRAWAVALLPRSTSAAPSAAVGAFSLIAILTMATTTKLVAGAVVLAAVLYGLRTTSDTPERMEPVASAPAPLTEASRPLTSGATGAARTEVAVAAVVEATEASDTRSDGVRAATRDPWLLELTVDGVGVPQRPTEVVLIGINGYNWTEDLALRVTFDAPGRTDIDLRRLIALWDARFSRDGGIAGVLLRVEHPECVSRTVEVDVVSDGSKDAEPTQPLTANVTLDRAAVLTGEVVFPGVDLADEVMVLAFAMGDDMPRDAPQLAAVAPDAHGRFRMRIQSSDRVALVALHARFRPVTRVVSVAIGASQELGRLEATVGTLLTGVVVFGEQPVGEGARVGVRLADAGRTWGSLGVNFGAMLAWRDGRFEWGQQGAVTDARGRFRCAGLGPWPVTVSCWSLPEHDSFGGRAESLVTPPTDIVVTVGMVAVELSYDFGGASATSGRMELQVADGSILEFDVPAHAAVGSSRSFTCAPDVPIVARAQFEGFEPAELSFRSPSTPGARVKQRFELKPSMHAPASLRVRAEVQGSPLPDGTILQLAFEPLESAKERVSNPRVEALTLVGGEAVLEKAPFGPYRLLVYPSETAWRRTTRYVDQVFDIELGAGDTRELRCDFVLGGNVSLEARAPEGHLVQGWCKVFDEQRREIDANFFTDLPGHSYGGFSGRGPSELLQNLLPGRYTIELTTTDYALYTDVLEIRPGEVTTKSFQLSRR